MMIDYIDQLYKHGWESDADCDKWWKVGYPETIYTFAEAVQVYEEWFYSDG